MQYGIIESFDDAKGYGFINTSSGASVFVHYTAIQGDGFKTLSEGQEVRFELIIGPKGLQATNVTKV